MAVRKVEPIPPKPIGKGDVIEATPAAVTDEKKLRLGHCDGKVERLNKKSWKWA